MLAAVASFFLFRGKVVVCLHVLTDLPDFFSLELISPQIECLHIKGLSVNSIALLLRSKNE